MLRRPPTSVRIEPVTTDKAKDVTKGGSKTMVKMGLLKMGLSTDFWSQTL